MSLARHISIQLSVIPHWSLHLILKRIRRLVILGADVGEKLQYLVGTAFGRYTYCRPLGGGGHDDDKGERSIEKSATCVYPNRDDPNVQNEKRKEY